MTIVLHYLVLTAFAGLMAVAAFEDFRRFTIPNWLTLSVCALWPAYIVAGPGFAGALGALLWGLAVFLVGALLFARGYIGGGDVKLLAAAILWAGPAAAPSLLIVTGLLGGVLAVILVSPVGAYLIAGMRARLGSMRLGSMRLGSILPPAGNIAGTPVPYGIAIAAAAVIVILPPQFS